MNTIEFRIKQIITAQLNVDQSEIKPASTLEELGADSLDQVELVMQLEDEFEMDISDDDGAALKTVQQVIDYVTGRVPT